MLSAFIGEHGKSVRRLIVLDQPVALQDWSIGRDKTIIIVVLVVGCSDRLFEDRFQEWLQLQCIIDIKCIHGRRIVHGHVESYMSVSGRWSVRVEFNGVGSITIGWRGM